MKNRLPQSALHDNRFKEPFKCDNNFLNPSLKFGTFDLVGLKQQAEASAVGKAERNANRNEETALQILSLLQLGYYRSGPKRFTENESAHLILEKIRAQISQDEPVIMTLSFYPAKVRNPLKTLATDSSQVDIGEVASLLRLYEITFMIKQVYPPGAKFIITLDGIKYHDVFDICEQEAGNYSQKIKSIAQYLEIDDVIEFVEETELYPNDYESVRAQCIKNVEQEASKTDSQTATLIKKIASNMALCLTLDSSDRNQLARVFCGALDDESLGNVCRESLELRNHIRIRAIKAAIKYEGTYRAPYQCGVYEGHLPNAVKCTVHPKQKQVGLFPVNRSTRLFPHHGQGTIKPSHRLNDVRVKMAGDILRDKKPEGIILDPEKYSFSDGKHPFFIED